MSKNSQYSALTYLNHFTAIRQLIYFNEARYDFKGVRKWNKLKRVSTVDRKHLIKIMYNSWATECNMRNIRLVHQRDDHEYFRFSLPWTFPMAYYSVYLMFLASKYLRGSAVHHHATACDEFAMDANRGYYPSVISYLLDGGKTDLIFKGFRGDVKHNTQSISWPVTTIEAEDQLSQFLKTTRKMLAKKKRDELNPKDDSFPKKADGKTPKKSFSNQDWDSAVYNKLGATGLLHCLYRMRVRSNYHNVDDFIDADIDYKRFHNTLLNITEYLNTVHEAQISKMLGIEGYAKLVSGFAYNINTDFIHKRFARFIKQNLH